MRVTSTRSPTGDWICPLCLRSGGRSRKRGGGGQGLGVRRKRAVATATSASEILVWCPIHIENKEKNEMGECSGCLQEMSPKAGRHRTTPTPVAGGRQQLQERLVEEPHLMLREVQDAHQVERPSQAPRVGPLVGSHCALWGGGGGSTRVGVRVPGGHPAPGTSAPNPALHSETGGGLSRAEGFGGKRQRGQLAGEAWAPPCSACGGGGRGPGWPSRGRPPRRPQGGATTGPPAPPGPVVQRSVGGWVAGSDLGGRAAAASRRAGGALLQA